MKEKGRKKNKRETLEIEESLEFDDSFIFDDLIESELGENFDSNDSLLFDQSTESENEDLFISGTSKKTNLKKSKEKTENDSKKSKSSKKAATFSDTEISLDNTVWVKMKIGGLAGRNSSHQTFKDVAGPTGHAKRSVMSGVVTSAFFLILTEEILNHIRTCTEEEALRVTNKEWTISSEKMKRFLAILYARGAYEANSLNASYLWSKEWGPPFFSKTMPRDDFMEVLRFIRFDKKSDRPERLNSDGFATISEVWDQFIDNSQSCYKPHENISIDEQLFPTKARVKFRQYMPNKPHKFGIKFWLAVDVKSKYILNGFPYLGKDESRSNTPLGEFVVLKLAKPYLHQGRTITTDNFFTSIPLAEKLVGQKTSLVGTIRSNKREIPLPAKIKKDKMELYSSEHYKSGDCLLTIYKTKLNLKVLLLSTKHNYIQIRANKKKIPETVAYYNDTKYGVDIVDQMAHKYTTKASSFRWPLQVFFNILDLAAINACILYRECTGLKISRKAFLFQLAKELAEINKDEHNNTMILNSQSSNNTINTISQSPNNSQERRTCQVGLCKRNRSNNICESCKKTVCGKCVNNVEYYCKKCAE